MTSFEKEIKKRMKWKLFGAIAVGIFVIVAFVIKLIEVGTIEAVESGYIGVFIGMFCGTAITTIYPISQYFRIIKSPNLLLELQIKETDERNRIITIRACKACIYISIILLAIAGIIAAFFSQVVSITIVVIMVVILVLYGILSIYYSRKI